MAEHPDDDTIEWIRCVLREALHDEALIIRLFKRGYLWLEWNPTKKTYLVYMRKGVGRGSLIELGTFPLTIDPSRFGGSIGLTHLPDDSLR
jgi:hypothetical protein